MEIKEFVATHPHHTNQIIHPLFFTRRNPNTNPPVVFQLNTWAYTHKQQKKTPPPQPIANLSIRIMWFEILGPLSDCFHPRDKLYWVNGLAYKTVDPCAVFTP